jgi:integrase
VQEYKITSNAGNVLTRYRPLFRLHDLRHSYASWLAEHGKPLLVIQKALGHLDPMTTDRYSHIADQSAVGAQDDFGDMLTQHVQ